MNGALSDGTDVSKKPVFVTNQGGITMSKSRKNDVIAFESPLDNELLKLMNTGKQCQSAMDVMLDTFQQGMEKTNAGYSAMRTLYKNSPSLVNWTTPLKIAGLLGDNPGDPSVDDVIEAGNHIKIVGPDGKTTDFSTKFLNNPTVDSFREKEKSLSARDKHYGNVLLAYMGAFLTEKKDGRFKNLEKGFDGINPLDPGDYQVYLEMPDKSRQILVDSATKNRRDELIDKIEASEKTMLSYPEEPRIPAPPRERNVFRRFFC